MSALERYLEDLIDESIEKGLKQGYEKGIEQGIEQGIKQGKVNIVLKMLKSQMDEKTIILMTEISKKELQQIKKEQNM